MSAAAGDSVVLLPREIRLVVERLLLLTSLPIGFVPAVRDVVLYSAIVGLGGVELLLERLELLTQAEPTALRVTEPEPGRFEVACGGQHAWVALPSLLDLAAQGVAERHGSAVVCAHDVEDPQELLTAAGLGRRHGMLAFGAIGAARVAAPCADGVAPGRLRGGHAAATLFAAPMREPTPGLVDPLLDRALREGLAVPAALWWRAHHLSNTALAPDTVESRRHAGPLIVMPDGSVIGRKDNDDDTDFSLLTAAGTQA